MTLPQPLPTYAQLSPEDEAALDALTTPASLQVRAGVRARV